MCIDVCTGVCRHGRRVGMLTVPRMSRVTYHATLEHAPSTPCFLQVLPVWYCRETMSMTSFCLLADISPAQPSNVCARSVFGVRWHLRVKSMPCAPPLALTLETNGPMPNHRGGASVPSGGASGLIRNGNQRTVTSCWDWLIAASRLRLPIQHQGQDTSLTTCIYMCVVRTQSRVRMSTHINDDLLLHAL